MADDQHDVTELATNGNTTNTVAAIEEDELELSLSLRPINSFSSYDSKNLLQTFSIPVSTDNARHQILSKRDAQAFRRHEAKLKRDLKRKAQVCVKNEPVLLVADDDNQQRDDFMQPCGKVPNLGFQVEVAPPWLGWNGGCYGGGLGRTFQGQNGNFASEGKDCASFSSGDSSSISDNHQSNSGAGANSSDAGSHSSHPHTQLVPSSVPSSTSEPPACSSQLDLRPNDSNPNPSNLQSSGSYSNKLGLASSTTPSTESPKGVTTSSNSTCQQNGASPNIDKGSRPNDLTSQEKLLFSQMPCVSTTGNGPNAKTITGFLYKYSKAEVSIICVCHGSSFSPAEFVEHAGGVDVEYPLRHIRVVPFGLG